MNIAEFRQQYPQYNDLSNEELANRLYQRFYSDVPREQFLSRFMGGGEEQAPQREDTRNLLQLGTDAVMRGGRGIVGLMGDVLPAQIGRMVGANEYADQQLRDYDEYERETQRLYPQRYQSYENVGSVGQGAEYLVERLGEGLPSLLPGLVTGGVGAVAGRAAVGAGASLAARQAAMGLGATIGSAVGAGAQNFPEVYQNIREANHGQEAMTPALVAGAINTALDSVLPARILNSLTGAARNAITGSIMRRLGYGFAEGVVTEGGTEGVQEAVSIAAESFVTGNPFLTSQNFRRMVDAAIGGAVVGGVSGGGSAVAFGQRETEDERTRRARQVELAQALRDLGGDVTNIPTDQLRSLASALGLPGADTMAEDQLRAGFGRYAQQLQERYEGTPTVVTPEQSAYASGLPELVERRRAAEEARELEDLRNGARASGIPNADRMSLEDLRRVMGVGEGTYRPTREEVEMDPRLDPSRDRAPRQTEEQRVGAQGGFELREREADQEVERQRIADEQETEQLRHAARTLMLPNWQTMTLEQLRNAVNGRGPMGVKKVEEASRREEEPKVEAPKVEAPKVEAQPVPDYASTMALFKNDAERMTKVMAQVAGKDRVGWNQLSDDQKRQVRAIAEGVAETPKNALGIEPKKALEEQREQQEALEEATKEQTSGLQPAEQIYGFDPSTIGVDADTFQFKAGGDEQGVTERLRGVKVWDPRRAGVALIYEYADGSRFIADGHQRLGLARRLQAEGQDVVINGSLLREVDGVTPAQARAIAAAKNIAEGTGTAVDAAKVIRDLGADHELIQSLPPTSAIVQQGKGLAKLTDKAFKAVVGGYLSPVHAAQIGNIIQDPKLQDAAADEMMRHPPASEAEAAFTARQVLSTGTIEGTQDSLFGEEAFAKAMVHERSKVFANAMRQIRTNRALFKTLMRNTNAIEAAGNKLNKDANQQKLTEDERLVANLEALANLKGPISDALTDAAKAYAADPSNKNLGRVTDDFLRKLPTILEAGPDTVRDNAGGDGRQDQEEGDGDRGAEGRIEDPGQEGFFSSRREKVGGKPTPKAETKKPAEKAAPQDRNARRERAIKVIQDRIAEIEAMGKQGKQAAAALRRALAQGGFTPLQMNAAFEIAETAARILKGDRNFIINFLPKIVHDGEAKQANVKIRRMADGVQGLMEFSLSPWAIRYARETAAHEAFHVIQALTKAGDPKAYAQLKEAFPGAKLDKDGNVIPGQNLKLQDVVRDKTIIRKLQGSRPTVMVDPKNKGLSYWDILQKEIPEADYKPIELQAYVFGALDDARRTGVPMTGLTPALLRVLNLFTAIRERLASTMRGYGYRNTLDLMEQAAEGGTVKLPATFADMQGKAFSSRLEVGMSKPEWDRFWKQSKAVTPGGSPLLVFHGTMGPIRRFDRNRVNAENFAGQGFYLTNSPRDASQNYADPNGPDRNNALERALEAEENDADNDPDAYYAALDEMSPEQIAQTYGVPVEDVRDNPDIRDRMEADLRLSRAQAKAFRENTPVVYPGYVSIQKPFVIGYNYGDGVDTMRQYGGVTRIEVNDRFAKRLYDATENKYERNDADAFISNNYGDDVSGTKLFQALKEIFAGGEDENGVLNGPERARQFIEDMGFDGIIMDAGGTFPKMNQAGEHHLIAFKPSQFKSRFNPFDEGAARSPLFSSRQIGETPWQSRTSPSPSTDERSKSTQSTRTEAARPETVGPRSDRAEPGEASPTTNLPAQGQGALGLTQKPDTLPLFAGKTETHPSEINGLKIEYHGTVSEKFVDEAREAIITIPSRIMDQLRADNVRIHLAARVRDYDPAMAKRRPSGWPVGTTWDNSSGFYSPVGSMSNPSNHPRVVVTESYVEEGSNNWVTSDRVFGVMRHELGHAHDYAAIKTTNNLASENPVFAAEWRKDADEVLVAILKHLNENAKKPADQRVKFPFPSHLVEYFVTHSAGDKSSRKETYAEAFGWAVPAPGRTRLSASKPGDQFTNYMPRSFRHLRNTLGYNNFTGQGTLFSSRQIGEAVSNLPPAIYYSPLERAVEGMKQPKATPDQWAGIIRNLTQKGVKNEEIEWTGVLEWLNGTAPSQDGYIRDRSKPITRDEVVRYIQQNNAPVSEIINDQGDTRFDTMKLPGGKSYRELLITMDPNTRLRDNFTGGHFAAENVLAHVRFTERTDSAGKPVLFVEEVQSDWHQQGRKRGYSSETRERLAEAKAKWERAGDAASAKRKEAEDAFVGLVNKHYSDDPTGVSQLTSPSFIRVYFRNINDSAEEERMARENAGDGTFHADVIDQVWPLVREYQRLDRAAYLARSDYEDAQYRPAIPDAPYKQSWPMLAMRRILKWAAENGFDKVAWPGTPQTVADVEKWGQVEEQDGKFSTAKAGNVTPIINRYIKDLPREVGAFTKRWGAKVERETVSGSPTPAPMHKRLTDGRWNAMQVADILRDASTAASEADQPGPFRELSRAANAVEESFDMQRAGGATQQEANQDALDLAYDRIWALSPPAQAYLATASGYDELNQDGTTISAFAVSITPEMKESVSEGVPLFSSRRPSSPLANDPDYMATVDKVRGKAINNSGILRRALQRFVGAADGEDLSAAFVRNSINRAYPGYLLDKTINGDIPTDGTSIGQALEMAFANAGRVQAMVEYGPIRFNPADNSIEVVDGVGGILDIVKDRVKEGDTDLFQTYLVNLRERDLRARGRKGMLTITDKEMNDRIAQAEGQHPEWVETARDLHAFNQHVLQFAVDTGILTPAKAAELGQMFYVPFYRLVEEDGSIEGPRVTETLNNPRAFNVALEGGEKGLGDLWTNIIKNLDVITSAGMKNVAVRMAAEGLEQIGQAQQVKDTKQERTVTFRVNGDVKHYQLDDVPLFLAITGMPAPVRGAIFNTAAKLAGFFRTGVTAAPSFMLANLYRGKIVAYAQEGASLSPLKTGAGFKDALKGATSLQTILAQTGFGGYSYGLGDRDIAKEFGRQLRAANGEQSAKDRLVGFVRGFERVSEATEFAERINLFNTLVGKGVTPRQAAFQAYLLAPFSRRGMGGGLLGQFINGLVPLVPFLNAKLQSLYRPFENEKGKTRVLGIPRDIFLRGTLISLFSLALAGMNADDERWDEETVDRKLMYDIIYAGGHTIYLPRAFEFGTFFGAIPVFIADALRRGDTGDLWRVGLMATMTTFGFNPIPQAAIPLIEVAFNRDLFRGRELENRQQAGRLPEERVNPNTSQVARALSRAVMPLDEMLPDGMRLEPSPIKIQKLIEGYTGTMGTMLLGMFDTALGMAGMIPSRPNGVTGNPHSATGALGTFMGVPRFVRTDEERVTRFVNDFYEMRRSLDQTYRSMEDARQSNDVDRYLDILDRAGGQIAVRGTVERQGRRIGQIGTQMTRIINDPDMDSETKADMLAPLRAERNRMARDMVELMRSAR